MKRFGIIVLFIVLIISSSCTIKQDIYLNKDGSGSASVNIEVMDGFYDYLVTFGEDANDLGYESDSSIFNTEAIREKISGLNGVNVTKISAPTDKTLIIEFSFNNIDTILEASKDPKLLSFISSGNLKVFRFFLNADTYYQIIPLVPVTDSPLYEALGPQPEYPISEQEYLDLVEFTIGEDGPDMVKDSYVTSNFSVNGNVSSQDGGRISGKKVIFEMPLLKFLLLLDTTEYKISFN